MAGLYFGIASIILGLLIIIFMIRVRNDGRPKSYFSAVAMALIFIMLGVALIIPYI